MKVKICGLKTKEAVDTAVQYGADFIGFVFAESKRRVSADTVCEITIDVPKTVQKVGIFVSPTREELLATIELAGLDLIQIHGQLPKEMPPIPYILAQPVNRKLDSREIIEQSSAEYLLFDAPPQTYVGGNGETFDWTQLDLVPFANRKVFIAGGLTSENVQEAKQFFHPYGVDVSSGVETNGEKDNEKIKQFLKMAKEEL